MIKLMTLATGVLASLLVVGCGNTFESVNIGAWTPAGSSEKPAVDPGERAGKFLSETVAGNGAIVHAGDLVLLRIALEVTRSETRIEKLPALWLWTGSEGSYEAWPDERANLGDKFLRAGLVGHRVGAQLELSTSQKIGAVMIPMHGIELRGLHKRIAGPGNSATGEAAITATIEIVNACKGALYQRTSTLTQWGYVFGPGNNYPSSRKGELYWGGLRGDCPALLGTQWLMSGPNEAAHGYRMNGGNLMGAMDTFRNKHSELSYPEDYWDVRKGVPAVLPKSLRLTSAAPAPTREEARTRQIEKKIMEIDTGERAPSPTAAAREIARKLMQMKTDGKAPAN